MKPRGKQTCVCWDEWNRKFQSTNPFELLDTNYLIRHTYRAIAVLPTEFIDHFSASHLEQGPTKKSAGSVCCCG